MNVSAIINISLRVPANPGQPRHMLQEPQKNDLEQTSDAKAHAQNRVVRQSRISNRRIGRNPPPAPGTPVLADKENPGPTPLPETRYTCFTT